MPSSSLLGFSQFPNLVQNPKRVRHPSRRLFTVFSKANNDDFITKILKENPTQVEPKYLVGDKLVTLRQKHQESFKRDSQFNVKKFLKRLFIDRDAEKPDDTKDAVYLRDILREFKGKLYVPEDIFQANMSEEEKFEKDLRELPVMGFEDLEKHLRADKIKLLISSSNDAFASKNAGFRDFVVELKDIIGDRSLGKSKWAIRLTTIQEREVLEEYKGPKYEIEKQTTSIVGKLPEYPNPVASSISSRVMVELGMVTALVAAAAAVITGFVGSAVFAVTSFVYAATIYVIWPIVKPFLKLGLSIGSNIVERIWDNAIDIFTEGGIISKINEIYTFGGVSASVEMLKPILLVFVTMVLLVRFTLSRRPKNFRKWDIWQGIEFGQSKPQARVDGSTGVKFSDVAGIDEAVEELQELVKYLKNPDLFDKLAIKPPHGVLMEGPPGCGKTLIAKAIAGEAGVPFYQMAGSEFVEVLVGVGSARIRDLFKRAKVNKPSVVFIDEIDALATRRQGIFSEATDHLYNAATQERETTLNQLLIELDGFDTGKGVIFLGATNRMDLLDPALLRPGRFDRKESALVAVRNRHESVLQSDIDDAVDRLTVGPKRMGIELGHQGQCRRAITEVGVAITSHLLRRYEDAKVEPCERISIIPRGQTLSQIVFHRLDEELYMFERRPQLLHRLQVLLGGRAAEEVIYGRDTSKASLKYLEDASYLARKILTIWNLENPMTIHGEPSPWRKDIRFIGPRLDFEGSLYDDYGLIEPPVNFELEDQVVQRAEKLIHDMYKKTISLLKQHHAALVKTIKVLLDNKEIHGDQIEFILNNYPAEVSVNLILDEANPGSLPSFKPTDENGLCFTSLTPQKESA